MIYDRILYKSLTSYMVVLSLLAISSCTNDDLSEGGISKETEKGLVAEARSMEFDLTRSRLDFSSTGMSFTWTSDDKLSVFAQGNDDAVQQYSLTSGGGSKTARFSSENFALTNDTRYYALNKTQETAGGETRIPSQNNITLDYSGQVQEGNANTSHLGKYDYMVSSSKCESPDHINLDFEHLGFTLRVVMTVDDANKETFKNTEFTSLEIYDSENAFRQQKRLFSFAAGTTVDGYTPTWPSQTITGEDRFTLKFEDPSDNTKGVKPTDEFRDGSGANNNSKLIAYIQLPAVDFSGKTIGFILKGKNGAIYYGDTNGYNMNMGKAYQVNLTLKPTTDYNVMLKINHDWQLGAKVEDLTRATGDPGNKDELYVPTYLYYILCVDGIVRSVNPLEGASAETSKAVNSISVDGKSGEDNTTADTKDVWSTTTIDDKTISTYGKVLTFKLQDSEKNLSKHLYVIASRTQLPAETFNSIIGYTDVNNKGGATAETTIQALAYSIQGVASTNAQLDNSQLFMRDLYSTPWTETNFIGNLVDPMQDVILYHVAAKVDLKWNSATAVTGDVKVNNVQNTNLSLFQPATINGTSVYVGTNDYTVTSTIEDDRMYNGRQVYYLPQFNTYNVTVGNKTPENVTFTPATTNGFTSWLRWLKKF